MLPGRLAKLATGKETVDSFTQLVNMFELDIGHVDQAIGADNGFAVHGRHSAATGWTFRAWFSVKPDHVLVVAAVS